MSKGLTIEDKKNNFNNALNEVILKAGLVERKRVIMPGESDLPEHVNRAIRFALDLDRAANHLKALYGKALEGGRPKAKSKKGVK